jgi:nanoRNase/pAp phosphatase (c-di-AMP/oligoRNAs hydrolase)
MQDDDNMPISAKEKLRRFHDPFTGNDNVLVVINADPDAVGSAMAVRRLLWRRVSGVTISNVNTIDRPDNLAMLRLLGVTLIPFAELQLDHFSRLVIVDSQPNHSGPMSELDPTVIIDHHPDTKPKAPFVDIRPHYGATSTILTEYLRAARIKPSAKLATGLWHGIKTDTSDFTGRTQIEDVRAFQYLFRHANIHLARKIEQADLRKDYLKYFRTALKSVRLRQGRAFVHLGPVTNPDVCVIIADFFMRINTVKWSIVSGLYKKTLTIIFRNDGIRRNAGGVASDSFGHIGSAGGHKNMARAEIDVGRLRKLVDYKDSDKLLQWISRQVQKKAGKK